MKTVSLNGSWRFGKLPGCTLSSLPADLSSVSWEDVTVPHTWYRDDDPYQGLAVYEKTVRKESGWRCALLSFDGADQRCRVFVNGVEAGGHKGGYSRFRLPVPQAAFADAEWRITVYLDNSEDADVIPSFGDFTVFGGLYRSVNLLLTGDAAFDRCYFGTDGLIVRTSVDDQGRGMLSLEPHTVGTDGSAAIQYDLLDEEGRCLQSLTARADEQAVMTVDAPRLWNGVGQAHLYTLRATLTQGGEQVDETCVRTGFRRIALTPDQGLLLNGRPLPLHGVARHHDRAGCFSACSDDQVRQDFSIIREMGANAVRLSHYQHPQSAYDCCDETGFLCWAEIPMLKMTESPALMENTQQQLRELILQNIHHPAIFCWGIQNEIAMFRDAPFMHENCRRLHETVKALDPGRVSTAANLYPLKASSHLNGITDMIGYNLYFGWYYGEMQDYDPYLDKMHAALPCLPFGISEYGVDANLALHAAAPKVKDYSEEYQALWHETVYPQIKSRPWMWGSFVWNMFDFSSTRRNEGGQRFINAKGLVSHDRTVRKDAFYYYKAQWSGEPFLHLCGRRYALRAAAETPIKIYTNCPWAELTVNGRLLGRRENDGNGAIDFENVPLTAGENCLTAQYGDLQDEIVLTRVETEPESYRLPDTGGGNVTNWFLQGEQKNDHFSIMSTAQQVMDNPAASQVIREALPELYDTLLSGVIPMGLMMNSILSRNIKDPEEIQRINRALQEIPLED